jgi:hypothetical protein
VPCSGGEASSLPTSHSFKFPLSTMRCEPLQTFRQTFVTGLQSQPQTAAWRGTKECLMTESTLPDDSIPEPTMLESAKAITRSSYLNVLLVFIPVSWAMHYAKPEEDELIFVCEFSTHIHWGTARAE